MQQLARESAPPITHNLACLCPPAPGSAPDKSSNKYKEIMLRFFKMQVGIKEIKSTEKTEAAYTCSYTSGYLKHKLCTELTV